MQRDDRKRFAAMMAMLGEYYQRDPSKGIFQMYWQSLSGYDISAVERAATAHTQDAEKGQFWPKIADLVRLIEGTSGDRAQLAWSKVHGTVRMVGPYQTLVFDDPIIHIVIGDMGGFGRLCDTKTEDMPFRAKEFEQRYRSYAARDSLPSHPAKIIGDAEADCVARGQLQFVPKPVFIGDIQAAQRVLEGGQARVSMITAGAAVLKALPNREQAA